MFLLLHEGCLRTLVLSPLMPTKKKWIHTAQFRKQIKICHKCKNIYRKVILIQVCLKSEIVQDEKFFILFLLSFLVGA